MDKRKRDLILSKISDTDFESVKPKQELLKYFNEFSYLDGRIFELCEIGVDTLWGGLLKTTNEQITKKLISDESNLKEHLNTHYYFLAKYYLIARIFFAAKFNIDEDIDKYIDYSKEHKMFNYKNDGEDELAMQVVSLAFDGAKILVNILTNQTNILTESINKLEDRYGTYPKALFRRAFELQNENKGKRPRLTNENAILEANRQLQIIEVESLTDKNGFATRLLHSIVKTYSNHHKKRFKITDV